MCEQCRKTRVSGEPLPPDGEPAPCEYIADPEGDEEDCIEEARFAVRDYSAEMHLCDEHMRQKSRHLDEGLGDFLRQAGFQKGGDFAPIKESAECEYVSPEQMVGKDVKFCGKPAAYAEMLVEESFLCLKHARMKGYDPKNPK